MSDGDGERKNVYVPESMRKVWPDTGEAAPDDIEGDGEEQAETDVDPAAVAFTDDMRAALNERQDMTKALMERLKQTLAAPRWAVFMMRWEDGKLPMEHVIYNWSDQDYPAIVNDVRKRVQQIQQETLAKRRAAGKEPLGGHVRSRTIRRNPKA